LHTQACRALHAGSRGGRYFFAFSSLLILPAIDRNDGKMKAEVFVVFCPAISARHHLHPHPLYSLPSSYLACIAILRIRIRIYEQSDAAPSLVLHSSCFIPGAFPVLPNYVLCLPGEWSSENDHPTTTTNEPPVITRHHDERQVPARALLAW